MILNFEIKVNNIDRIVTIFTLFLKEKIYKIKKVTFIYKVSRRKFSGFCLFLFTESESYVAAIYRIVKSGNPGRNSKV